MVREAIVLTNESTGERFTFPVNPETIGVQHGRSFSEVAVINLDSVLQAGNLTPTGLSWEGFFPRVYDPSLHNYVPESPEASVRRLEKWLGRTGTIQTKPVPLRTVVTGTYFSRMMVISEFSTEFRGGEPGDVYYTIVMQSWRAQTIRIGSPSPVVEAPTRPVPTTSQRTHTVRKGDTLWAIAKALYGQGSQWPTIYNANTAVIGSNPNLIKPGQVLVIP